MESLPLRIAVVTDYASTGGASVAATRLCVGLRPQGHAVGRIYCFGPTPGGESADAVYPLAERAPWNLRISSVVKNEIWRRISQAQWAKIFRGVLADFRPDVVDLHNLHGAQWDIEVAEECLRHAPVVWTLHDMWALTGTCAHSFDCRKFEEACDRRCPQVDVYPTLPARMIAAAHTRRRVLYARRPRLVLAAPSQWLTRHARAMTRGAVPALRIGNGLDLQRFRPIPKTEARGLLRLPDDGRPCLLAVATSFSNRNKGAHVLAGALRNLGEDAPRLVLMGQDTGEPPVPPKIDIVRLGVVSGDDLLAVAYSAADLLVHPSLAENQPLVVMEAFACGVPAAALPVGGVPEMVIEGETGWLAREPNAEQLAEALKRAFAARAEWAAYGARCRAKAETEYDAALQARRYAYLLGNLTNGTETTQESLDALVAHDAPSASPASGLRSHGTAPEGP